VRISSADQKSSSRVTLIALGLSILFLNSWDNLSKASVGLFWVAFFLILNGPQALKTFRNLANIMTTGAPVTNSQINDSAGVISLDNLSVTFGGRPIPENLQGCAAAYRSLDQTARARPR
jgi:hypothetical protein